MIGWTDVRVSTFHHRPHGLFIDNRTQRLFAVSHSDLNKVESIVVMAIFPEG